MRLPKYLLVTLDPEDGGPLGILEAPVDALAVAASEASVDAPEDALAHAPLDAPAGVLDTPAGVLGAPAGVLDAQTNIPVEERKGAVNVDALCANLSPAYSM